MECPFCSTECLVKLFDLQNHVNEDDGFSSIKNVARVDATTDQQEPLNERTVTKHLFFLLGIAQLLLILFIIGIYNIAFINEKFPALARLYAAINILPERGIIVKDFSLDFKNDDRVMVVDVKIANDSDYCDLVNSVQIIVFDVFNSPIAETLVQPNSFIKSRSDISLKIQVTPMSSAARKVVVLVNGKEKVSKKLEKEKL
jgi:hypothetical protein